MKPWFINLQLRFSASTGETGSEKSMHMGALGQLTGERSGPDIVRDGEEKSIVEGKFDISKLSQLQQLLLNLNIPQDNSN